MGSSNLQSTKWQFSIPLFINYEDTDAGGVVYYGNYLGYMERVRNAFLRQHGFPLGVLAEKHHIMFVVREVRLRYLLPARLDDELEVTLGVAGKRGAVVLFRHQVLRGDELLVEGEVTLATISNVTFKPCRIPVILEACFNDD